MHEIKNGETQKEFLFHLNDKLDMVVYYGYCGDIDIYSEVFALYQEKLRDEAGIPLPDEYNIHAKYCKGFPSYKEICEKYPYFEIPKSFINPLCSPRSDDPIRKIYTDFGFYQMIHIVGL